MTPDTIDRHGCGCGCGCSFSGRVLVMECSGGPQQRMRSFVSRFIIRLVAVATDVRALICKPQTPTSDTAETTPAAAGAAAASRFGLGFGFGFRLRLQLCRCDWGWVCGCGCVLSQAVKQLFVIAATGAGLQPG